ncbi:MAG: hypothetical protein QM744_02775 [Mesorhizobium sp.]
MIALVVLGPVVGLSAVHTGWNEYWPLGYLALILNGIIAAVPLLILYRSVFHNSDWGISSKLVLYPLASAAVMVCVIAALSGRRFDLDQFTSIHVFYAGGIGLAFAPIEWWLTKPVQP